MSRCMITMMRMMKLCDGFNQKEQRHIGSKRTFTFVAKKDFSPMLDGPCTSIDSMESMQTQPIM